ELVALDPRELGAVVGRVVEVPRGPVESLRVVGRDSGVLRDERRFLLFDVPERDVAVGGRPGLAEGDTLAVVRDVAELPAAVVLEDEGPGISLRRIPVAVEEPGVPLVR